MPAGPRTVDIGAVELVPRSPRPVPHVLQIERPHVNTHVVVDGIRDKHLALFIKQTHQVLRPLTLFEYLNTLEIRSSFIEYKFLKVVQMLEVYMGEWWVDTQKYQSRFQMKSNDQNLAF